jgi:hypothetical protein
MEETMSKLLIWICLLGATGLIMVGGCTPESDDTWSESLDFGGMDPRVNTVNGTYIMYNDVDERFTTLTLWMTGSTVQGSDNMRRNWRGTAFGDVPPGATETYSEFLGFQIQTNDGPEGQVVLAGTVYIYVDIFGNCYRCIHGVMYSGDASGSFDSLGPSIPCDLS